MSSQRPSKKPKRAHPPAASQSSSHVESATSAGAASFISQHHPEKPSARSIGQAGSSRRWTSSIAIPASIVLNAQTPELRSWLVGQIARTCAIFSITEIVVYTDTLSSSSSTHPASMGNLSSGQHRPRGKYRDPTEAQTSSDANGQPSRKEDEEDPTTFLARILEYLETPQYLRRALFPLHPSLRLAGLLPPLDMPHHLRRDDDSPFREGVVVQSSSAHGKGLLVDVGLWNPVEVEPSTLGSTSPEQGSRVTIRMPPDEQSYAHIVAPLTPSLEGGLYWGYSVRVAPSLAHVFSQSPYAQDGGYDLSIGTSERGEPVEGVLGKMPPFKHMILTLGPLSGLELVIASDPRIALGAEDAGDLFDHWINVIEGQGSRTVRTEEALPIALARLKSTIEKKGFEGTQ